MVTTEATTPLEVSVSSSTSADAELIKSFQKLLIDTSGDIETLKVFDTMISNEIDRASSDGSEYEDTVEESKAVKTNCKVGVLLADLSKISSGDIPVDEHEIVDSSTQQLVEDTLYEHSMPRRKFLIFLSMIVLILVTSQSRKYLINLPLQSNSLRADQQPTSEIKLIHMDE